jgi:hypothetical protein
VRVKDGHRVTSLFMGFGYELGDSRCAKEVEFEGEPEQSVISTHAFHGMRDDRKHDQRKQSDKVILRARDWTVEYASRENPS